MKILFYTDLHAAHQTPRSRTGSYRDDILLKLREIIDLANQHEVDFLVNGADTFDRKSPWQVSHDLVREMIEIMRGYPAHRHLTVVGTHDVPTGRLDKLPQQPLGILAEAGAITVLDPTQLTGGLIRLPDRTTEEKNLERTDSGRFCVFHPVPASYDLDKDPSNYAIKRDDRQISTEDEDTENNPDDPIITIAHGMIVPPGHTFFGDYTDATDIGRLTDADAVLYGHPHTPDGVFGTSPDGVEKQRPLFVGPGSVTRRDSSPYNRTRTPQVAFLEFANVIGQPPRVGFLGLNAARPGPEVFKDVIRDEEDENTQNERVNQFVETLKSARISDDTWGADDLITEVNGTDARPEVKQLAADIIETHSQG